MLFSCCECLYIKWKRLAAKISSFTYSFVINSHIQSHIQSIPKWQLLTHSNFNSSVLFSISLFPSWMFLYSVFNTNAPTSSKVNSALRRAIYLISIEYSRKYMCHQPWKHSMWSTQCISSLSIFIPIIIRYYFAP